MRLKLGLLFSLMAVTLLAYWQCGSHDFIILDDQLYVTQNPAIQGGLSWQGICWAFSARSMETSGNWHPVTWLSHMADLQLFGVNPAGHHLVNVFLHALNVGLLFLVLSGMSGAIWLSAAVAAVFALHPLHVESVAWVAERKDVLSIFFWMLTLLFYLGYQRRPGALRYLATLAAFVVGLMAKPMLVSLPVVLLLFDYWPLSRFPGSRAVGAAQREIPVARSWQALFLEKVPFVGITAVFCALAIAAQHRGGYVPDLATYPLKLRLYNALLAYQEYLVQTFWPHDLAVYYPFPVLHSLAPVLGAFVLLAAVTLVALYNLRRRPYLLVGWLWFLVTLVPVIGIVQVGHQSMADRYMYVPLVGLAIMVVWGVADLIPAGLKRPAVLAPVAAAVCILLGVLTWRQLGYWQDSTTLLTRTLSVTEGNYYAHGLLGNYLFQKGKYREAELHYLEAVRINPTYDVGHYKLGMIAIMNEDLEGAIRHLSLALRLAPNSENAPNARITLGRLMQLQGAGTEVPGH